MTSALLIDLDGVVYQNNRLIDGALDALAWFHERQVPYLFVTNTTSRSRATLVKRFSGFGFDVDIDELMTPIVAAREYLASHSMRRLVSFVSDDASVDFDGFDPALSRPAVFAISPSPPPIRGAMIFSSAFQFGSFSLSFHLPSALAI